MQQDGHRLALLQPGILVQSDRLLRVNLGAQGSDPLPVDIDTPAFDKGVRLPARTQPVLGHQFGQANFLHSALEEKLSFTETDEAI